MKSLTLGNPQQIKLNKDGILSPTAERELIKLLKAQELINEIVENIKSLIGEQMGDVGSIEQEGLKITKSLTGRKYSFDPASTVDPKFSKPVTYQQVNSTTVQAFVELNGKPPKGILENARKQNINITVE